MLKVPNNKTIFSLALRQLKSSWLKNIFSVAAIILTTMLIMTILTIGNTLMEAGKAAQMKDNGQKSEVSFQCLLKNEADAISSHDMVEKFGASRIVAGVHTAPWDKTPLEIRTADEEYADMTYSLPTVGRLPENKNEIAVKTWMLKDMGLPCEIGQKFPVSFDVDNKHYELEFTVSGIWSDNKTLSPYATAYISVELADELLQNTNVEENISNGTYIGSYQAAADLDCKDEDLKSVLDKIVEDTNTDPARSVPRVNEAFRDTKTDKGTIAAVVCILIIVMISGFFLIYNIFFISIEKNIRSYGMLKTIGTTSSQIKRMVNIQSLIYCLIGIPCGLAAGYFLSAKMFPYAVSISNVTENVDIVVSPVFVASAALLSLITVFISCRHPAKYASKITPIESMRFNGTNKIYHPKKNLVSKRSGIFQMGYANLFRNKKKTVITIVSVVLGMILVNVFYTFSKSFDVENMTQTYIYGEVMVADKSYVDFSSSYNEPTYTLKENDVKKMSSFEGVKNAAAVYFRCDDKTYINSQGEPTYSMLYGLDDYWYDILEDSMISGDFDKQKFQTGKYIIIAYDKGADVSIGDTVTVNKDKEYEVMGKVSYEKLFALSARYNVAIGFSAYLPASELVDMKDTDIMSLSLFADDNEVNRLKDKLDSYISLNNKELDYTVKSEYKNEIKKNNSQFSVVSITLSFVILLIGMINFINTSISEIISRKYETAILNAIGMTSKQIRSMQMFESLIFALIVSLFYVPVSTLLSYLIIGVILRDSGAFKYHFSIVPIAVTMLLLIVTSVIIPLIVSKFITKKSAVERLSD